LKGLLGFCPFFLSVYSKASKRTNQLIPRTKTKKKIKNEHKGETDKIKYTNKKEQQREKIKTKQTIKKKVKKPRIESRLSKLSSVTCW